MIFDEKTELMTVSKPIKRKKISGVKLMALLVLTIMSMGVVLLAVMSWKLPSVSSLREFRPMVASEVYSEEYIKIGEFFEERRIFVSLPQIPRQVVNAFVAAEDGGFYEHKGISISGIMRAFLKNMVAGEVKQGGSTITQQVAKGLLLSPERSLIRKMREAILAFKMENFLSKEQILEIYLNQIYLGQGAHGIEAAAQVYFHKTVTELTLGESAMLAGLTRAPSRDNPFTNPQKANAQQQYVLSRMKEENYITQEEMTAALTENVRPKETLPLHLQTAPYFVEHVRRAVTEKYGNELVLRDGLQIFTTLQVKSSLRAQKALKDGLENLDRHQGYRGPLENISPEHRNGYLEHLVQVNGKDSLDRSIMYTALVLKVDDTKSRVMVTVGARKGIILLQDMNWAREPNSEVFWSDYLIKRPSQVLKEGDVILVSLADSESREAMPAGYIRFMLTQEPLVQGALVALEPQTGAIRAMVGGYDFEKSEFNRAVQARRQPGSAFKPLIYTAALDHGYTPASVIVDAPIVYDDPTSEFRWKPKNYGGKFYGDTIFRDCLIKSRNVPTIKIVQDLGMDVVLDYARRFGIESPLERDQSIALGTSSVTPLELINAYAVFATGGRKAFQQPIGIKKIVSRDGVILEQNFLDDPNLSVTEQAVQMTKEFELAKLKQEAAQAGKTTDTPLPEGYVISPQTAYIMTHLLKQVIQSGTGHRAAAINRPAAGKTGTTNENYDAWFIGFTPELIAGVWLGFDEAKTLGMLEEGGRAASPIWLDFMQEALADIPPKEFEVPEGLVFVKIDAETGKLASAKTKKIVYEVFKEGTEPTETTEENLSQKSPQQFFLEE